MRPTIVDVFMSYEEPPRATYIKHNATKMRRMQAMALRLDWCHTEHSLWGEAVKGAVRKFRHHRRYYKSKEDHQQRLHGRPQNN